MRKMRRIKSAHRLRLAKLYNLLSEFNYKKQYYSDKANLENDINNKISKAHEQLSADIFELQMDIFKKITEK